MSLLPDVVGTKPEMNNIAKQLNETAIKKLDTSLMRYSFLLQIGEVRLVIMYQS